MQHAQNKAWKFNNYPGNSLNMFKKPLKTVKKHWQPYKTNVQNNVKLWKTCKIKSQNVQFSTKVNLKI